MIALLLAMLASAPRPDAIVDCRYDGGTLEAICAVMALNHGSAVIVDGTCHVTGKHVPVVLRIDTIHGRLHAEPQGSCK